MMMFNLLPFYAEALARPVIIRKDIDRAYSLHKEDYYITAKNSEFYDCLLCRENSLLTEEYFKKCIGLLEYADKNQDDETLDNIFNLFKKAYRKTYKYFQNIEPSDYDINLYMLDMRTFLDQLDDDTLNANITAAIFFTNCKCKNINEILEPIVTRWEHNEGHQRISLDKISKEVEQKLLKLYDTIPKNILDQELLRSNKRIEPAFDYIYDLEGLSSLSLFRELKFEKKDIKEVILAHMVCHRDSEEIDLKGYVIPALNLKAMCKAYNLVKDMYFANNKETMYLEMRTLQKKLLQTQTDLEYQKTRNTQLIQSGNEKNNLILEENDLLKKQIKDLHDQIDQMQSDNKEVIALREYIFNHEEESLLGNSINTDDIDIDKLNSVRGVIIGGHTNWQNKIKESLPSWKIIRAGVNTLDNEIIQESDLVIFNTGHLNHSLYYKIMDLVRNSNLQIGYISSTNISNTLREIFEICKILS